MLSLLHHRIEARVEVREDGLQHIDAAPPAPLEQLRLDQLANGRGAVASYPGHLLELEARRLIVPVPDLRDLSPGEALEVLAGARVELVLRRGLERTLDGAREGRHASLDDDIGQGRCGVDRVLR